MYNPHLNIHGAENCKSYLSTMYGESKVLRKRHASRHLLALDIVYVAVVATGQPEVKSSRFHPKSLSPSA